MHLSTLICWIWDSEFEDALVRIPDRPRISGSSPLLGFKRNEYGSSPPARGDSSNYSRGSPGKWESRSGRSDRDTDSQSDRDPGSVHKYYVNLTYMYFYIFWLLNILFEVSEQASLTYEFVLVGLDKIEG